jgi:hypothetical protein
VAVDYESGAVYVEAVYDDGFGFGALVYAPMTGKSVFEYWSNPDGLDAIGPPTHRFELGDGLARGLVLDAAGFLSLTRWMFDEDVYLGVELVPAFVSAPGEEPEEEITFFDPVPVEGGSAVELLPGNSKSLFSRALTGYASGGLETSDNALQMQCPNGSERCGLYIETREDLRYVFGCSTSGAAARYAFESGSVRVSGDLATAPSCTRMLGWTAERGFELSLISASGDSTRSSSEQTEESLFHVLLDGVETEPISMGTTYHNRRDHLLIVSNWLDEPVLVEAASSAGKAEIDTVSAGSGSILTVQPGPAVISVTTGSTGGQFEVEFPFRDFVQHILLWPPEAGDGRAANVAVFDDRGTLVAGDWMPPVRSDLEDVYHLEAAVQVYPNPFHEAASISVRHSVAGSATLEVIDLKGRVIRRLHEGHLQVGLHHLRWDGRMNGGESAPSGLYLIRVDWESGSGSSRPVLLVR